MSSSQTYTKHDFDNFIHEARSDDFTFHNFLSLVDTTISSRFVPHYKKYTIFLLYLYEFISENKYKEQELIQKIISNFHKKLILFDIIIDNRNFDTNLNKIFVRYKDNNPPPSQNERGFFIISFNFLKSLVQKVPKSASASASVSVAKELSQKHNKMSILVNNINNMMQIILNLQKENISTDDISEITKQVTNTINDNIDELLKMTKVTTEKEQIVQTKITLNKKIIDTLAKATLSRDDVLLLIINYYITPTIVPTYYLKYDSDMQVVPETKYSKEWKNAYINYLKEILRLLSNNVSNRANLLKIAKHFDALLTTSESYSILKGQLSMISTNGIGKEIKMLMINILTFLKVQNKDEYIKDITYNSDTNYIAVSNTILVPICQHIIKNLEGLEDTLGTKRPRSQSGGKNKKEPKVYTGKKGGKYIIKIKDGVKIKRYLKKK